MGILTATERAALDGAGAIEDESAAASAIARRATDFAAMLNEAHSVEWVAQQLELHTDEILRRMADGELCWVRSDSGDAVVAAWQFCSSGSKFTTLPHLSELLRDVDMPPLTLAVFFTCEHCDLESASGSAMTPREWLIAGHDPAAVRDLLAEVLH